MTSLQMTLIEDSVETKYIAATLTKQLIISHFHNQTRDF